MSFTPVKALATNALLLCATSALAAPFSSYETRSMAMGGVGVAVGYASTAPLYNPALLSVTDEGFALVLPTVGARILDQDKLLDAINDFQDGKYLDNLQKSVDTFNATPNSSNATSVANNITSVSNELKKLSDKPLTVGAGAAVVAASPGKIFGTALYGNYTVDAGGVFNYRDASTLSTLSSDANLCGSNPVTYATNCNNVKNFSTSNLQSGIRFRGVTQQEVGLAMSHDLGYMSFGLTPKIVKAKLFDLTSKLNSDNQTDFNSEDNTAEYSFGNLDLGIATFDRGTGWRTGLVVKNVITQTLDFKYKNTQLADPLVLKPQARMGISHSTDWSTIALDYDLTSNAPVGLEEGTKYTALGIELNAFDWIQLRAGYRIDNVNSARNITSVGVGLAPFGIPHIDVAYASNDTEKAASVQFGVHF